MQTCLWPLSDHWCMHPYHLTRLGLCGMEVWKLIGAICAMGKKIPPPPPPPPKKKKKKNNDVNIYPYNFMSRYMVDKQLMVRCFMPQWMEVTELTTQTLDDQAWFPCDIMFGLPKVRLNLLLGASILHAKYKWVNTAYVHLSGLALTQFTIDCFRIWDFIILLNRESSIFAYLNTFNNL